MLAAMLLLGAPSAHALKADDNTLIEGAKLCTRYLPRHERQYGIPTHLLAAIASTESGRYHKALGLNLPWPWTINIEGQGYFFDTKEEAVAAVRSFQARGFASIDVGCMQVNLHHHPNAFATLDQAFDPAYNVAYAAQFLKNNFAEEGSWRKATADYHSRTPTYGEQYAGLVYNAWSRIINKVADARAGRPIVNASAKGASGRNRMAGYHAMHMHDISVAHDTTKERGVIVIRPQHEFASISQPASFEQGFVTHPKADAAAVTNKAGLPSAGKDVAALSEPAPAAAPENHGAQIVKIQGDKAVSNTTGQFEGSSRVVHVNAASASPSFPAPNVTVTTPSGSTVGKSPFVFDN